MLTRWLIVGSGRCGMQLARAMTTAGVPLAGVVVRSPRGRERVRRLLPGVPAVGPRATLPVADAVLVTVPDDRIASCADELSRRLPAGVRVALHTSGLHPGELLAPLREHGVAVGSFHPLLSFPSPGGAPVPLAGATAAIEGEAAAVRLGLALARALRLSSRRLAAADKPVYHAAAAIAANLTHVLVTEARGLLERIGLAHRDAARALSPLVSGSVAAALAASGLERLTGPISRGGGDAVRAHLRVLDEPLAAAYRSVGLLALARMRASRSRSMPGKSAQDSVLRALTGTDACGSVPADVQG